MQLEDRLNRILYWSGQTPTFPSTKYKSEGTWLPSDLSLGQFAINVVDKKIWYCAENEIVELSLTGGTGGDNYYTTAATLTNSTIFFNRTDSLSAYSVNLSAFTNNKQTLTDQATIEWNMLLGNDAFVTIAGDRTIAEPSGATVGGRYSITVIQDGVGSRLLTWNSVYKFPGGVVPVQTSTANARDMYEFKAIASNSLICTNVVFNI